MACRKHRLLVLALTLVGGLGLAPGAQAAGAATSLSLQVAPPTVQVGGTAITATVMATAAGAPVPGETIVVSSSDPSMPPQTATDNLDGTYTATFNSSKTAGPVTFTANDSAAGISSQRQTITQTPGPPHIALSLQPPVVKADGASSSTATATVADAFGNAIVGDTVSFSSSNPGDRIFPQPPAGNVYTATIISSTQPGPSTITANDSTAGISTQQTLSEVARSSTMNLVISPPSPVSTNQTVSLFATVSSFGGSPDGTITFLSGGFFPIAGCASSPISPSNTVATCQTSFLASSSPVQVSAIFTPDIASTVAGASSTSTLVVVPGSTTTSLEALSPIVNVGASETYTAVVAPSNQGPDSPTGSVLFKSGGKPIHRCASVPVRSSGGALSASCRVRYTTRGTHRVTAIYSGDQNFGGSSSSAALVSVQTLGVLTSTVQWTFAFHPAYTTVASMTAFGVSPGTKVIVTCNGPGCPFARRVSAQSGGLRCTPTGKHRCGNGPIDLAGAFHRSRLMVGTRITIEIRRPGWIGKFYAIVVRAGRQPQVRIKCLAPGLSKPGVGC